MLELQKSVSYFRDKFVPFAEANLSIASASVLYGLSIYTVMPVFWNDEKGQLNMFRLEDHFRRLQNSARIVAFDDFLKDWDYQKFQQVIRDLLKKNHVEQDGLVRITIFVDDILKGARMKGLKHSLSVFVYPSAPPFPLSGAKLGVSSWRRTSDNAIPARAKINGSYVNAALMKHEATSNGFDDAIALDEAGHVTESTVSNIFFVRGGKLITPTNSADLLEGITRDTIFKLAGKLRIDYEEKVVDRSELYIADEIFLCGSSMNIAPVVSVDHRPIADGKPGQLTKKLINAYEDLGHGQAGFFKQWLTPIG